MKVMSTDLVDVGKVYSFINVSPFIMRKLPQLTYHRLHMQNKTSFFFFYSKVYIRSRLKITLKIKNYFYSLIH